MRVVPNDKKVPVVKLEGNAMLAALPVTANRSCTAPLHQGCSLRNRKRFDFPAAYFKKSRLYGPYHTLAPQDGAQVTMSHLEIRN